MNSSITEPGRANPSTSRLDPTMTALVRTGKFTKLLGPGLLPGGALSVTPSSPRSMPSPEVRGEERVGGGKTRGLGVLSKMLFCEMTVWSFRIWVVPAGPPPTTTPVPLLSIVFWNTVATGKNGPVSSWDTTQTPASLLLKIVLPVTVATEFAVGGAPVCGDTVKV